MAAQAWAETVALCDKYINDHKPWALAKDPALADRLASVLGTAMDALWTLSVVMSGGLLPEGAIALARALGKTPDCLQWHKANELLEEASSLGEKPMLYPRLELPKVS
jgi:methionyl-tRNA synthetase